MDARLATVVGVGFVLGLRHALDPDHVVAVTAIVSERGALRRTRLVGLFWGLGHALSLSAAGGAILALKLTVPDTVAQALESVVALMLVGLGASAIRSTPRYRLHAHAHAHDGSEHVHFHAHQRGDGGRHHHGHPMSDGLKPFLVGLVHGLAGSAGLALLALGTAPSVAAGLAYIAMLGAGTVAGMLVLTVLMSLPLAYAKARYPLLHGRVQLTAGAASAAFGLWLLGHQILAGAMVLPAS